MLSLNDEELTETLVRFGITRQEAEVFLLLTKIKTGGIEWVGGREAASIAHRSRVRIYQVLERLTELGLVSTDFSRPKKYSAVAPQVAVRRLMGIHEDRLTELSHLEGEVVDGLLHVEPPDLGSIRVEEEEGRSNVVLLRGLPNIQNALRRVMECDELELTLNEESSAHILGTLTYLSAKPAHTKLLFSGRVARRALAAAKVGPDTKTARYDGQLPTIIITDKQCLLLHYSTKEYRPRPLSAPTTESKVSDCILVESPSYVRQMKVVFGALWDAAKRE
jgi:sugar-specific transcriptional regulator TrmB